MAKKKSKYCWKKTAWKFGKNAVYVVLAGLAATYGENHYYLALAPALVALENYLRHRK
jgi:uncharacterized membrane protein|tara:strand:+ start:1258 stop:1431 length:174 start_codon:yes stop_codon:yes gene_type:complete